jgi:hypothetical protein
MNPCTISQKYGGGLRKYKFYALEAHIMYLTVSCSFLISFVMGDSGLNAPEVPEQGD